MKKKVIFIIILLLVTAVSVLIIYISGLRKDLKCSKVDINIIKNDSNNFVDQNDIAQILTHPQFSITGKNIDDIEIKNIEKRILRNPYISNADVYISNDGCLKINATVRKVLVRVINNKGKAFYLDEDGYVLPTTNKFTPRVIIAHGNIDDDFSIGFRLIKFDKNVKIDTNKLSDLHKVYLVSKFINNSDFWKAMIDNIYLRNNGDIEIFTAFGNFSVIIGGVDNLNEKFIKLKEFYSQKINKIGWNKYKSLNLKYNNQIICIKN